MNKRVLLLMLAITASNFVNAQKVGFKAGLNFANMEISEGSTLYKTNMLPGFHAGLLCTFPLGPVELEGSFLLARKGYNHESTIKVGSVTTTYGTDVKPLYLDLPLKVNYVLKLANFHVFGGTGITLSYGVGGKSVSTTTISGAPVIGGISINGTETKEEVISWGNDEENNDLKPFDSAVSFQAGIRVKGMQASIFYDLGLVSISHGEDINTKNRVLGVSVGYLF